MHFCSDGGCYQIELVEEREMVFGRHIRAARVVVDLRTFRGGLNG